MKSLFRRQLPNWITLARIAGVGLIFWFTPYASQFWQLLVIHIYIIVCITDFLDGWVARRFNMISDVGKVLDPLADKILVLVFLPLLEMQVITSFPVFIILAREFAIMALRVVGAKQGASVSARFSGKLKTSITLPVCGILLGRVDTTPESIPLLFKPLSWAQAWVITWPSWFISLLIWSVVVVTILSFLDYFRLFIWQALLSRYNGNTTRAKKAIAVFVPNTFTLLNLCCGIGAVILSWFGHYSMAISLVLSGIMFDAADGSLARKLDVSSALGAKLDSKADILSFGLAPTIVIYKKLSEVALPYAPLLGVVFALLYGGSVVYRLNRFDKGGHSDIFQGLPSPIGAAVVLVAAISPYLSTLVPFISLVIIISGLMVSTIAYMHFRLASRHSLLKYLVVPTAIFFILTLLKLLNTGIPHMFYTYEILFLLTMIYVVSPIFVDPHSTISS